MTPDQNKEKFTIKEFFYDKSFNDYPTKIVIDIPKARYGGEFMYYISSITITFTPNGREKNV